MRRGKRARLTVILLPLFLGLLAGCDAADITAASLDLAGAILDAST